MSTLDIRNETTEPVDTIIVGDDDRRYYNVQRICNEDEVVVIDGPEHKYRLAITSEQHARDIIKGIEKAIDLGWFKGSSK